MHAAQFARCIRIQAARHQTCHRPPRDQRLPVGNADVRDRAYHSGHHAHPRDDLHVPVLRLQSAVRAVACGARDDLLPLRRAGDRLEHVDLAHALEGDALRDAVVDEHAVNFAAVELGLGVCVLGRRVPGLHGAQIPLADLGLPGSSRFAHDVALPPRGGVRCPGADDGRRPVVGVFRAAHEYGVGRREVEAVADEAVHERHAVHFARRRRRLLDRPLAVIVPPKPLAGAADVLRRHVRPRPLRPHEELLELVQAADAVAELAVYDGAGKRPRRRRRRVAGPCFGEGVRDLVICFLGGIHAVVVHLRHGRFAAFEIYDVGLACIPVFQVPGEELLPLGRVHRDLQGVRLNVVRVGQVAHAQ